MRFPEEVGPGGRDARTMLQPRYAELLDLVDQAVNDYVNTDGLIYTGDEDEGGFSAVSGSAANITLKGRGMTGMGTVHG